MNPYIPVMLAGLVSLGMLSACQEKPQPQVEKTAAAPHPAMPDPADAPAHANRKLYGSVVETFDAGGFTYTLLNNGNEQFWAAGPLTALQPGMMIAISAPMPMKNFHSKNLDRDFELIYFTDTITTDAPAAADVESKDRAATAMSPHAGITNTPASKPVTGMKKAEGGYTIAEIIAQKDQLDGKPVRVRGKVVKYTSAVLGHNWIHILDGSSGTDLTITTNDTAALDDIIVAEGTLGLGKDFGYGYIYDVILENASVEKEQDASRVNSDEPGQP